MLGRFKKNLIGGQFLAIKNQPVRLRHKRGGGRLYNIEYKKNKIKYADMENNRFTGKIGQVYRPWFGSGVVRCFVY